MRIRMVMGEYEQPEPYALDVYLAPVEFPMEVEWLDEDGIPQGEPMLTLHTEEEFRQWADKRFAAYEIWDMEVPQAAIVAEEQA